MDIRNRRIKLRSISVRYLTAGESGPPLILVHGLGASADIWERNIRELGAFHRVYAPDLIGFGHTDKPDIRYSPSDLLAFLKDFIDALGFEKVNVIGQSLGGGISLLYAIENPERIDRLILVDSAGLGREMTIPMRLGSISFLSRWFKVSRPALESLLKRMVYNPDIITADLIDLYCKLLAQPDAMRTISRVLSSVANLRGAKKDVLVLIRDRLNEIKSPTLIIWGKEDRILPLEHGIYGQQQITGSRLYVFDRCGHLPNLERPREFNELVLKFFG